MHNFWLDFNSFQKIKALHIWYLLYVHYVVKFKNLVKDGLSRLINDYRGEE